MINFHGYNDIPMEGSFGLKCGVEFLFILTLESLKENDEMRFLNS